MNKKKIIALILLVFACIIIMLGCFFLLNKKENYGKIIFLRYEYYENNERYFYEVSVDRNEIFLIGLKKDFTFNMQEDDAFREGLSKIINKYNLKKMKNFKDSTIIGDNISTRLQITTDNINLTLVTNKNKPNNYDKFIKELTKYLDENI